MAARAEKLSRETRITLEYARRSLLNLRRFVGRRAPRAVMQADADAIARVHRALGDTAKRIGARSGRRWPPDRKPAPKLTALRGGRA